LKLVSDLARQLDGAIELEKNNGTAVKITFAEPVYTNQVDLMTNPRILIIEDEILIVREPEAGLKGYAMPWSASAVIWWASGGGVSSAAIRAHTAVL
jgi:hypothetical protein